MKTWREKNTRKTTLAVVAAAFLAAVSLLTFFFLRTKPSDDLTPTAEPVSTEAPEPTPPPLLELPEPTVKKEPDITPEPPVEEPVQDIPAEGLIIEGINNLDVFFGDYLLPQEAKKIVEIISREEFIHVGKLCNEKKLDPAQTIALLWENYDSFDIYSQATKLSLTGPILIKIETNDDHHTTRKQYLNRDILIDYIGLVTKQLENTLGRDDRPDLSYFEETSIRSFLTRLEAIDKEVRGPNYPHRGPETTLWDAQIEAITRRNPIYQR